MPSTPNFSRWWFFALAAALSLLLSRSVRHATADLSTAAKNAVSATSVVPRARPAFVKRSVATSAASATPRSKSQAAIHAKLGEWFRSHTGDDEAQARIMDELLAMLANENASDITQSLSSDELRTPFGAAAFARWLEQDSSTAARWIATRSEATNEHALLVAKTLLSDPASLDRYCAELPDGSWKQAVLHEAALHVIAQNPTEAIRLAGKLDPGTSQTDVWQTAAYDWTGHDPSAALAWMSKVNDPVLREQLLAVGAKAIAITDPDLAAVWLAAGVKSNATRHETALCIVETWVAQDPVKAAAWVASFPVGETRTAAVDLVLREWKRPDAATAWLSSLPDQDTVIARRQAALVASSDPGDPE